MKEHKSTASFQSEKNTVVTIGTFDGVHIGHQKIIKKLVKSAKKEDLESVILTFFPHPRMVLQKDDSIKLINTIDEKKQLLAAEGVDHLIVHPFTKEFSQMEAAEFVQEILLKQLKAKKIIIGYDHRFGKNRSADISDLKKFGEEFGFEVEEISKQEVEHIAVSSTKIRNALFEGKIKLANKYLSRPFMLSGTVVKGKGLGKDFGFPTANIEIAETYKLIPKIGVYVVRSVIEGVEVYGMMSIGFNPTVGGTEKTIEAHFFDFEKDIYGEFLQIEILKRIRDEINFGNTEDLKEAIQKDEVFSRAYIKKHYAG
ncbi:MAG TPA: bifunctional riboflavin kinase/FAD synthetase [Salinimicrobium sp.]|nr:bifunctional riboflavin kinase/FAD synthetase [Salinimicrobium sp.]